MVEPSEQRGIKLSVLKSKTMMELSSVNQALGARLSPYAF